MESPGKELLADIVILCNIVVRYITSNLFRWSHLMLWMIRVHMLVEEVPHVSVGGIAKGALKSKPVDVDSGRSQGSVMRVVRGARVKGTLN